jgi:hypothetical protein
LNFHYKPEGITKALKGNLETLNVYLIECLSPRSGLNLCLMQKTGNEQGGGVAALAAAVHEISHLNRWLMLSSRMAAYPTLSADAFL